MSSVPASLLDYSPKLHLFHGDHTDVADICDDDNDEHGDDRDDADVFDYTAEFQLLYDDGKL